MKVREEISVQIVKVLTFGASDGVFVYFSPARTATIDYVLRRTSTFTQRIQAMIELSM